MKTTFHETSKDYGGPLERNGNQRESIDEKWLPPKLLAFETAAERVISRWSTTFSISHQVTLKRETEIEEEEKRPLSLPRRDTVNFTMTADLTMSKIKQPAIGITNTMNNKDIFSYMSFL